MTTPSDTVAETDPDPRASPPAALSTTRPLYWSVRRELWESRSIYIAPLIAAAVVLFGFAISTVNLPHNRRALLALDPARQGAIVAIPYDFAAMAIILTGFIVAIFYCLGALHNERRDRGILFWKSLPVSDLTTVLSKAAIPLIVLPLAVFVTVIATQLVMLVMSAVVLAANGLSVGAPSTPPLLQMSLVLLYGLGVIALWYAPIYGWLMLVSGGARRTTFLWAFLPPLALCLVEKIAFDSTNFASLLAYRLGGFWEAFTVHPRGGVGHAHPPQVGLAQLDPVGFLSTPGLWAGLAVAAAFLAAAVWQRRRREPI
ncbi:MAG: ABC transporter permease [Caulobacteraceae bacterium]|nr:ABC transporter permease [Caulobacteraceae bacterium]